jgi:hypothetical protein
MGGHAQAEGIRATSHAEIIQSIHDHARIVAEALARLAASVGDDDANVLKLGSALQ